METPSTLSNQIKSSQYHLYSIETLISFRSWTLIMQENTASRSLHNGTIQTFLTRRTPTALPAHNTNIPIEQSQSCSQDLKPEKTVAKRTELPLSSKRRRKKNIQKTHRVFRFILYIHKIYVCVLCSLLLLCSCKEPLVGRTTGVRFH